MAYKVVRRSRQGFEATYRLGDPAPIGISLKGDHRKLLGKVIQVTVRDVRTIHLVTDARYERGKTALSFKQGRAA